MIIGKIIKGIFFIINLVVIFCLLMVLLGSVISPASLVLPAYFALLAPFFIFANLFFVLFWAVLKSKYILFSLVLLILSYPKIKNVVPLRLKTKENLVVEDKKTISILSYNTMINAKVVKHTKNSPNPVVQYIVEQDPDIFCIQEFKVMEGNSFLNLKDLLKAFSKHPYHYISYPSGEKEPTFGIATFSKYPIVASQSIDLEVYPNSAHYVDIDVNGTIVRLVNNHLESNRLTQNERNIPKQLRENIDSESISEVKHLFTDKLGVAYKTRAKQADIISGIVKSSPHKIIVVGDFNDVPLSYTYSTVKADLSDAFSETGKGFGWTYHESAVQFRIDYILYDKTFTINHFKTDKVYHSDHYPISCKLTIN